MFAVHLRKPMRRVAITLAAVALVRIERREARWLIAAGLVATGVWMQFGHFERWSRLVLG